MKLIAEQKKGQSPIQPSVKLKDVEFRYGCANPAYFDSREVGISLLLTFAVFLDEDNRISDTDYHYTMQRIADVAESALRQFRR